MMNRRRCLFLVLISYASLLLVGADNDSSSSVEWDSLWGRYLLKQQQRYQDEASATTTRQRRHLQNNDPVCGEIVDQLNASELGALLEVLVQDALDLSALEFLAFQSLVLSQVEFGVQIQKVCGRCSDWHATTSTICTPDDYGYDAVHSGLLVLPFNDGTTQSGTLPVNILCHGTQSGNQDVPSNQWNRNDPDAQVLVAVLLTSVSGSAAILPDYLGYAESAASHYRPYLVRRAYPTAVWPLWQQAEQDIAQQTNCATALADSVTVMGYSEGGYAAVAVADALHQQGKTIIAVHAGGGPYKLSSAQIVFLWNQLLSGTFASSRRYYLALLAVVYSQTTTDVLNYGLGQNMLEATVRNDIINVVHSSVGQSGINAQIPVGDPMSIIDPTLADTLTAAVQRGETEPCVTSAVPGDSDIVCAALQANDLDQVLESVTYPVYLCHSSEDSLVTYDNLPDISANPTYLSLNTVTGSHSSAGATCYLPVLQFFLDDANVQNFPVTDKTSPGGCPTASPTSSPTTAPSTLSPTAPLTASPTTLEPSLSPTTGPTSLSPVAPTTQEPTPSPTNSTITTAPTISPLQNNPPEPDENNNNNTTEAPSFFPSAITMPTMAPTTNATTLTPSVTMPTTPPNRGNTAAGIDSSSASVVDVALGWQLVGALLMIVLPWFW